MERYFSENGEDNLNEWKAYLIDKENKGELEWTWNLTTHGCLGRSVRNWMRQQAPWIDEEFQTFGEHWYGTFEDYSWGLFAEIVDKWIGEGKVKKENETLH